MLTFHYHLNDVFCRIPFLSHAKDNGPGHKGVFLINRRDNNRVEIQLPCRVEFPAVWSGSQSGLTANLHRNGMLVACRVKRGIELPALGATASVHIELPPSQHFPPKFMRCDTTLLRVEQIGESEFHFALQILNVDFAAISASAIQLMELDSESCDYIM